jgi:hypothetical protein
MGINGSSSSNHNQARHYNETESQCNDDAAQFGYCVTDDAWIEIRSKEYCAEQTENRPESEVAMEARAPAGRVLVQKDQGSRYRDGDSRSTAKGENEFPEDS